MNMQPLATVYLATNTVNGKRYVGVTRRSVRTRFTSHVYTAMRGSRTHFHRAIAKHGPHAFTIEPIASCLTVDAAVSTERALIQTLRPEYNQTNGGEFTVGRQASPESRARVAEKNRSKKRTPEQKALNSELAKARYRDDPEWATKVIGALAKSRLNIDQKKRAAAAGRSARERVWTPEMRARLGRARMGIRHTPEVIAAISAKKNKPVRCLNTGEIFKSVSDAAKLTGISIGGVSKVCLSQRNSANGLRFEFVSTRKD
jgi:group I intron endonuclease